MAVEEGRLRDATVEVVFVYEPPKRSISEDLISRPYGIGAAIGSVSADPPSHHPPDREAEAEARAMAQLEQVVAGTLADIEGPEPVLRVVSADHPAEGLIGETETADLLVIGTRGLGGFTGMLLGSVAHQIIQHSRCPLLILPPES